MLRTWRVNMDFSFVHKLPDENEIRSVKSHRKNQELWLLELNLRFIPLFYGKHAPRAVSRTLRRLNYARSYLHFREDVAEGISFSA